MRDSRDDISMPRRQAAVMASKSHSGNMSRTAPIRVDILSASITASSRDRQWVRDLLLVALTVASGAVDAISYFGLGKIFSAFMTGNLVFLGLGIAETQGPDVVPVIVALSMFTAGAYLGLRFTTLRSKESGLWPPAMTVLLAAVAVAEAGFLVVWLATAGHPTTEVADVLIALFSLAMGIQTAAVRSLGVQGIFTTAGTFTLVAFAGTFAGSRLRSEMPRLVGVLLGLIAGAVAGGLLFLHVRSYAPVLPLVSTVLVILVGRTMHRSGPALGETQ
ncbi:MAG: hypothetical protein JWR13_3258 [Mycobacterium sp.]|jgi:uncharacterized membrane protein YoaK (UPF0700 family)|nr:hypothetical protein [Mycobacterium sp.]